jgi:hypothetical protein
VEPCYLLGRVDGIEFSQPLAHVSLCRGAAAGGEEDQEHQQRPGQEDLRREPLESRWRAVGEPLESRWRAVGEQRPGRSQEELRRPTPDHTPDHTPDTADTPDQAVDTYSTGDTRRALKRQRGERE